MNNPIKLQYTKSEMDDRVDRWHQGDIMVPLQSYLCLNDEEWHAFLNGVVVYLDTEKNNDEF